MNKHCLKASNSDNCPSNNSVYSPSSDWGMTVGREQTSFNDSRAQAVNKLIELGLFIPLSEIELYHGRIASPDENGWQVDKHYDNTNSDANTNGDNLKRHNVCRRPVLYTGNYRVASDFALARAQKAGSEDSAEVYRIFSDDPKAMLIDTVNFNKYRLSKKQYGELKQSMGELMPKQLSIVAPLTSQQAKTTRDQLVIDKWRDKPVYIGQATEELVADMGLDDTATIAWAGAINAYITMLEQPDDAVLDYLLGEEMIVTNNHIFPFSHDYINIALEAMHVVGVYHNVKSGTLSGKSCNIASLFNLDRINTYKALSDKYGRIKQTVGQLATTVNLEQSSNFRGELRQVLTDPNASPEQIVEAARQVPKYGAMYNLTCGVVEGFTLGQHTETVLGVFEKNYAGDVPVELMPVIRLMLLVHDIGKPAAYFNCPVGDKPNQTKYNAMYGQMFMDQIGVDQSVSRLLIDIITKGEALTTGGYIRDNLEDRQELDNFCRQELEKYGIIDINEDMIAGLRDVCLMLQTCDSAAYTKLSLTRDENTNSYYRNRNTRFLNSFSKNSDSSSQRARLRLVSQYLPDSPFAD